jgi:hypothetical protein
LAGDKSFPINQIVTRKDKAMAQTVRPPQWRRYPDPRDRLIIALFAQLEAERQTRETLRMALRAGALDPAVLEAIAEDPVPATSEDIASLERSIALRGGAVGVELRGEDWR